MLDKKLSDYYLDEIIKVKQEIRLVSSPYEKEELLKHLKVLNKCYSTLMK